MKLPNGYGGITKLSGKRRRPYWVRITTGWDISEGKQKQKFKTIGYFATRKEALLALSEYNANPYDLDSQNITFEEIWEKWSEEHFEKFSASSERGSRAAYNKCAPLHKMKVKDIRTTHLKEVMKTVSHMSPKTQSRVKSIFKSVFAFALENDIVQKDYSQFISIDRSKQPDSNKKKYFTREEVQIILNNLDFTVDFPYGVQKYTKMNLTDSVVILLHTGMRIGELLNLKCEDVDLENRTIHVHGTKTESANRIVPIHKNIISYLENRMGKTYLFENVNGKPITYKPYLYTFFRAYMESLGLEGNPHSTRHTFISLMDDCGVTASSVVLKRIVGHSNDSVTEHYTHKELQQLIKAIDKLIL